MKTKKMSTAKGTAIILVVAIVVGFALWSLIQSQKEDMIIQLQNIGAHKK